MAIIFSKAKSVKVLKAYNHPNLRIFPGYNTIKENPIVYFNNPAAEGMKKAFFSIVPSENLTNEEKKQAAAAKAKNDELNKAQKIIKLNDKQIIKDSEIIAKQIEDIKALQIENAKFKKNK